MRVEGVDKNYDLRPVLSNVSFRLQSGDVLGITGHNGSGKSTLMKILANVLERTAGSVSWVKNGTAIDEEALHPHIGYVAPYLQLYTEFTPKEHLQIISQIRNAPHDEAYAAELFRRFGLADRTDDPLNSFSSGMLQRAKYVIALSHHPDFLFLDEPMTNLDAEGIETVRSIVEDEQNGRITLIATNDRDDLQLCSHRLALGEQSILQD